MATPMRSRLGVKTTAAVAAAVVALSSGAAYGVYRHAMSAAGHVSIEAADALSITVIDRNQKLLRAFTTPDAKWRLPVEVTDVDGEYIKLLMAFEDKRFREHGGVDGMAIGRAVLQAVRHGRLVSGGSTLTMQVARLLDGRHERTASGKLRQMARALALERKLSKDQILRIYLRLAPFGGNLEGVRAATLAYFGKEPRRLSLGEAALLVALPQSPEARRLDRHPEAARRARNRVLDRAVHAGVLSEGQAQRAKAEKVPHGRIAFPMLAPHLAERAAAAHSGETVIRTTIERDLQARLETLAVQQAPLNGDKVSAAILVADHGTGEIIARVGASDYFDGARQGPVDMVSAVRSPGSALKPFIYGLAFEAGYAHPETLIDDRPVRFGNYAPKNFDETFHGTISMRAALAGSLNIPAVRVLNRVGPGRLVGRFRRAGVQARFPDKGEPTLAMALGGTGLTMQELAQLYAALARGGDSIPLYDDPKERARAMAQTRVRPLVNAHRLMSPLAASYVTQILKDAPPPLNAKGGRFAYKTGTSYGYRDAWAVGYDGRHVVAVWVGRPDGASVPGMMGRSAAAPILFDTFQRISERRVPLRPLPQEAITSANAQLPVPLKHWREAGEDIAQTGPYLERPVLISFPPDNSEIANEDLSGEPLTLKAEGGALPLTWLVDGAPLVTDPHARDAAWHPAAAGFAKLTVIDANGRTDRVSIRLK